MRYLLAIIGFVLITTSCVPGFLRDRPGTTAATEATSQTIIYQGSAEAAHAVVIRTISTASPLASSSGWSITQNDLAAGFVRAETHVTPTIFGVAGISYPHSVAVLISEPGDDRVEIIVQSTSDAAPLAQEIIATLDEQLGRAE